MKGTYTSTPHYIKVKSEHKNKHNVWSENCLFDTEKKSRKKIIVEKRETLQTHKIDKLILFIADVN